MTSISAVLACRNEEHCIEAWLQETATYADEILIALHAPTDATPELVAAFKHRTAIPIRCWWFPADTVARFGFSLMKNELLSHAQGDWITSIDADEYIAATRGELEQAFADAHCDYQESISMHWLACAAAHRGSPKCQAYALPVPRGCGSLGVRKTKLFRNRRGFWWRGLIHEEIYQQSMDGVCNGFASELQMLHYVPDTPVSAPWKEGLYAHLICRIRDYPQLRPGTHRWWYEDNFMRSEAAHRAAAKRFTECFQDWYPNVARRCP